MKHTSLLPTLSALGNLCVVCGAGLAAVYGIVLLPAAAVSLQTGQGGWMSVLGTSGEMRLNGAIHAAASANTDAGRQLLLDGLLIILGLCVHVYVLQRRQQAGERRSHSWRELLLLVRR